MNDWKVDPLGHAAPRAFKLLRRYRPILSVRKLAVLSLADDVRSVLEDHDNFAVPYEAKMTAITGPFILGLDDTPLYRHDREQLRKAVRPDDLPILADAALEATRMHLEVLPDEFDVVAELIDPLINQLMTNYLGTPGPGGGRQLGWARDLFADIFLNVSDKPAVHERALRSAAQMRLHLDELIRARKADLIDERDAAPGATSRSDVPDDTLSRLLRQQPYPDGLHDRAIRHNLMGLIAGWIPTLSKAAALCIDELLRRPAELAGAQAAARQGDRELVSSYLFEALRFRPQTWAMVRTCVHDTTVASGTPRSTTIASGARVLLGTQSAMFDPSNVPAPNEFRLDRDPQAYLHFGHGLHACFGREIVRAQLPSLALALLEGPPLRRAAGAAGRLRWNGPYPSNLVVRRA